MSSVLQLLLPLTRGMGAPGCPPVVAAPGDLKAALCQLKDTAQVSVAVSLLAKGREDAIAIIGHPCSRTTTSLHGGVVYYVGRTFMSGSLVGLLDSDSKR